MKVTTLKPVFLIGLVLVACLSVRVMGQQDAPAVPAADETKAVTAPAVEKPAEPAAVPAAAPAVEKPAEKPAEAEPAPVAEPAAAPAVSNDATSAPPVEVTGTNAAETGVAQMKQEDETAPGFKKESDSKLSIHLDDVEISDVVKMFTRLSKANIIATTSNLQGHVTVNLEDVEWQPALESILDMHGLALLEKTPGTKVYSIVPKVAGPEPLKVGTFFLKYASVSNAMTVISSMVGGGSVQAFASRNALVVRATSANLGEIKQVIEAIDILREQVFIEAKFLELNDEAIKNLGINWQVLKGYQVSAGNMGIGVSKSTSWTDTRGDTLTQWDKRRQTDTYGAAYDEYNLLQPGTVPITPMEGGAAAAAVATAPGALTASGRGIADSIDKGKDITTDIAKDYAKTVSDVRAAVLGAGEFSLILSALKEMNGVSVVSNPKIIVANEEPAIIHIGSEERPFVATVTPATQTTAPIVTYNPGQPVPLGVKLTVTPTVNTASNITVKIEPELTRFLRDAVAPNGQTFPVIGKKTLHTVFCLESGKTVAIGGLTETIERDVSKSIPLLGDIPLIGKYLFSHTSKEKRQQETIIFVTVGLARPEIIQKNDGLPEDTELTHRRVMRTEAKKHEFQKDVEKERRKLDAKLDAEKARTQLLRSK